MLASTLIPNPIGHLATLCLITGLASAMGCWLIIRTEGWHGRLSHDNPEGGRKIHHQPTPRIGGVALMLALGLLWLQAPGTQAVVLGPILAAALPAFLAGLADDLGLHRGAALRLAATLASGVLAWWWAGLQISRTGTAVLDAALLWLPVSVLFTVVALAGMANAVNLIDGVNGQAGGVSLIVLLGLAAIAWRAGDAELAVLMLPLVAVMAGFLALNFPRGRIFLGDGGAYLVGFLMAAAALLLMQRNAAVSPWAVLLVAVYPVHEVLFSMWRRRRRGRALMQADGLHLHSLLQRRLMRQRLGQAPLWWQNAAVAPITWLLALLGAVWGVVTWAHPVAAASGLAVFALAYSMLYRRMVRFGRL